MKNPGPPLEALIDRLVLIPAEFYAENITSGADKKINIPAIVNDLLLDAGGIPLSDEDILKYFSDNAERKTSKRTVKESNYPGIVSILCFIYKDRFFTGVKNSAALIKKFILSEELSELSKAVNSSDDFINDPERREEICRIALDVLNYYPLGENEKNSKDRLLTLNSVERKKILIKTNEAQLRAKQLHEAMMRQEAEEAASKMSRE